MFDGKSRDNPAPQYDGKEPHDDAANFLRFLTSSATLGPGPVETTAILATP